MEERRICGRVRPGREIQVRVNGKVPARLVDLSPKGAQLESLVPLRPLTTCSFALSAGSESLALSGRVLRCRAVSVAAEDGAGHRMVYRSGVEFSELDNRQLLALILAIESGFKDVTTDSVPTAPRSRASGS